MITFSVEETEDKAIVEVEDTGKGIRKKDLKNVFRPGFHHQKARMGLGTVASQANRRRIPSWKNMGEK